MNPKDELLRELASERERLTNLIAELTAELKVIERLIDKRTSTNPESISIKQRAVKPLQAIEGIFENFPEKSFTPSEIKTELGRLKREGLLITQSKNLLNVVHSSLKTLMKKGIIIKIENLNPPRYKFTLRVDIGKIEG